MSDYFTLQVWNLGDGTKLHDDSHRSAVRDLAFSPDGTLVVSASTDSIRVRELATGKELASFLKPVSVRHLRFSADGENVEWVANDLSRRVWAWRGTEAPAIKGEPRSARGAWATTPDASRGAVVLTDNTIRLLGSGQAMGKAMDHARLAFSPDGRWLLEASVKVLVARRTEDGSEAWRIRLRGFQPPQVRFSACGRCFLIEENGFLRCIETRTGSERFRLGTEWGGIAGAALSPDGRRLAYHGYDGVIVVRDLLARKDLFRLPSGQGSISTLAFSDDGRRLATGALNSTVLVWDVPPPAAVVRADASGTGWLHFGDEDAAKAFAAMASAPLRDLMEKRPAPDAIQIGRWIADLDAEAWPVRERASAELASAGKAAEGALKEAMAKAERDPPLLEVKRRASDLLARLKRGEGPALLRAARLAELLEMRGDMEKLEAMLAEKDLPSDVRDEVKAGLERLRTRRAPRGSAPAR